MPRVPIDYSKTILYYFVCNDASITDTYVGHTTDITRRKSQHKYRCCNEKDKGYNFKLYQNIRANGGFENWNMTPLEQYPCENDIQARIREQYWMDQLQAKMNDRNAHTNYQEYQIKYREEHKQQIKQYNDDHKEERKLYYEANKEYIAKKKKEKYEKNKEVILEKAKATYTCVCDSVCRIGEKLRHEKSQKHINYIANV